jgi:hypothetical protein
MGKMLLVWSVSRNFGYPSVISTRKGWLSYAPSDGVRLLSGGTGDFESCEDLSTSIVSFMHTQHKRYCYQ